MPDDRSSQTKQPQSDTPNKEDPRRRLIQHRKVRNRVARVRRRRSACLPLDGHAEDRRARHADLLQDRHVLARAPDGVDGDVERQLPAEEAREFTQAKVGVRGEGSGRRSEEESFHLGEGGRGGEEEGAEGRGDEGGVLDEVAEGAFGDGREGGLLCDCGAVRQALVRNLGRGDEP